MRNLPVHVKCAGFFIRKYRNLQNIIFDKIILHNCDYNDKLT